MSTIKVSAIQDLSGGTNVNVPNAAKAWVNFNGTGTVAIRTSFNVSSITDNTTGDYTVNFTSALADANYSVSGLCTATFTSDTVRAHSIAIHQSTNPTTTAVRIRCGYVQQAQSGSADPTYVNVICVR